MTFSSANFISPELSKSPLNDIISNMISGYTEASKARYLQPSLAEQLKKAQLQNKWYEPNIQSEIGLRGAQAGHLGSLTQGQNITNRYLPEKLKAELASKKFASQNPLLGMTGSAGQVGALLYLQQHPELMKGNSGISQNHPDNNLQNLSQEESFIPSINQNNVQQAQQAPNPQELLLQSIMANLKPKQQAYALSNLGKLEQEYRQAQQGYYPGTQTPFSTEQEKEEFLAPYREKLGGLKQGEHYIYDQETHEKIGNERPFTPKERETETGRVFFNQVFPDINHAFKDFVGKDSVRNFVKYANDYGKNEIATRKIDDLLLGQKLISAGVVNEASTLGAGKTNQTYKNLLKSFPGSDIPALIERYGKELKLPSEAFYKAGIRFQDKINKASTAASNSVPAMKKVYFHPEKYLKSDEQKSQDRENKLSSSREKYHYSDADIRNTAEKYGISEEEVRKMIKKAIIKKAG